MIFVTGGTGLLGNCIVRELCDRGMRTRALCRPGNSQAALRDLDVEIVEGDLENVEVLNSSIQGCTAVIHSAALIHIGWSRLEQSRSANVQGTRNVASACLASGSRLIHVSTVDTFSAALDKGQPISEEPTAGVEKTPCSYVVSKKEAEQAVREAASKGLDTVIVHPGFMLGPYDWKPSSGRMMVEVNNAPIVAAPPGGCSVCDARDVARTVVDAIDLGQSGRNYILAGRNLTYQEFWQQILHASGKNRRVWRLGKGIKVAGRLIDFANRLTGRREGDVNGASIAMGTLNHYYSSERAEKELGYFRRPLDETLTDAWEWLSSD